MFQLTIAGFELRQGSIFRYPIQRLQSLLIHTGWILLFFHHALVIKRICSRYYGSGIKFGECGVTISSATHQHTGLWSCNMGQTNVSGTDASERVSVRIVGICLLSNVCKMTLLSSFYNTQNFINYRLSVCLNNNDSRCSRRFFGTFRMQKYFIRSSRVL